MNLIVAVDKNWGIGLKNQLLVRIPNDMKMFRAETMGKVIVMGRKTLESFPQSQPLAKRVNIVLTKDTEYKVNGATVVHSMDELMEELTKYEDDQIYVIGGGSVYKQLLDKCNVAHVTKIDESYEADTFFPNLDEDPEWKITATSEEQTYFDIEYAFVKYERVAK